MTRVLLSKVKKVFTGESADKNAVLHDQDIHIENGKIIEIRAHNSKSSTAGFAVVDASQLYVTPGIIDCHSHITVDGLTPSELKMMNGNAHLIHVEKILYQSLVFGGVTSLIDMGGATHLMKRMVSEGVVIGPNLQISIAMLSTTAGHADVGSPDRCHGEMSKLFPPGPGRPSSLVDGPWDCRKRVRELESCGADFIKACAGRGFAVPKGGDPQNQSLDFAAEELQSICDEANKRSLKVACHAHTREGVEFALDCGVTHIQHGTFLTTKELEKIKEKAATFTPTTWIIRMLSAHPVTSKKMKLPETLDIHEKSINAARDLKVTILAGSDSILPGMHGKNFMELVWLHRYGLDGFETWFAATGAAANAHQLTSTGKIAVGKNADLLFHKSDVIENPALLENESLLEVMKEGLCYKNFLVDCPQVNYETVLNMRMRS